MSDAVVRINLPKGYSVWKVIAICDDDVRHALPIECQIIGPVTFPPKRRKRKVQRR